MKANKPLNTQKSKANKRKKKRKKRNNHKTLLGCLPNAKRKRRKRKKFTNRPDERRIHQCR